MNIANRITIGITTKNRWEELLITINKLIEFGLGNLPYIIIDDGSKEPRAEEICKELKDCSIIRENISLGLIMERNRIALMAKTDYLISLDDDSCFEMPHNLENAVEYMDQHQEIAVLGFWIVRTNEKPGWRKKRREIRPSKPVPIREYNGCGHMLRVETFRKLGGYRGYFRQMCEERDYSLRIYRQEKKIVLFPAIQVTHRLTPVARSSKLISFYSARNTLLCWFLNAPMPLCLWNLTRTSVGQIISVLSGRQKLVPTIGGLYSSILVFLFHRKDRQPLTSAQFRRYLDL